MSAPPIASNVTFIDRNFDEALALMEEARNYAAFSGHLGVSAARAGANPAAAHPAAAHPAAALWVSYNTARVVSRLVRSIAWLAAERAHRIGRAETWNASKGSWNMGALAGLADLASCADESGPDDKSLPKGLRSLLDRSYRLYMRIARLEAQTRKAA